METMKISELLPADYNPRKDLQAGDPEFEQLKKGIAEFGLVQPIVYNKRNNVIVGGHQRLKAAAALGYTEVPVMSVDLDIEKEKALNLALNKISGDWDEDKLGIILSDLKGINLDIDLTGFDMLEVEELTFAFDNFTNEDDGEEPEELYHEGDDNDELSHYDDGEEEGQEPTDERGYVIQTNIIFDDETQQETWHTFVRLLKSKYDAEAFPTIASRLHAHLVKEIIPALEREDAERE